ncbi:hypothetical protein DAPPUDRAFT_120495 [Daphnia pulex]|uniref:Uncharacterized protein n=1 Tax=Daphnia pulex TaxID=6669 RepID=E9I1K2_DAPPU|nr:hypothetical protein DAPPUDRAFT_120495 [Daphnia pulex]|eukprot:EFX62127.1 hypothetical protein DAPPUDRAFT_120495 [Daphnia pulex]
MASPPSWTPSSENAETVQVSSAIDSSDVSRNLSLQLHGKRNVVGLIENQPENAIGKDRSKRDFVEIGLGFSPRGVLMIWPKCHSVPLYCRYGLQSLQRPAESLVEESLNAVEEHERTAASKKWAAAKPTQFAAAAPPSQGKVGTSSQVVGQAYARDNCVESRPYDVAVSFRLTGADAVPSGPTRGRRGIRGKVAVAAAGRGTTIAHHVWINILMPQLEIGAFVLVGEELSDHSIKRGKEHLECDRPLPKPKYQVWHAQRNRSQLPGRFKDLLTPLSKESPMPWKLSDFVIPSFEEGRNTDYLMDIAVIRIPVIALPPWLNPPTAHLLRRRLHT